mgnify:CR=1 FL=1
MSGLLCIFIGLLAEIQSRIYFESIGRPPYLIRQTRKTKKDGCSVAFKNHKKTKTVINIVPSTKRCKTLKIDHQCIKKHVNH